jgi:hypothetical protein
MAKKPQVNGTRTLSGDELAAIRAALKSEGLPIYPERILHAPAEAPLRKTAIRRAPSPR